MTQAQTTEQARAEVLALARECGIHIALSDSDFSRAIFAFYAAALRKGAEICDKGESLYYRAWDCARELRAAADLIEGKKG